MRVIIAPVITALALVLSGMAHAQPSARTVYGHLGEDAGGAGFLLKGEKQWAIGADFGIEGKQVDRTGDRVKEESGLSFNLLVGIAAVETEHWRVVPFGLIGARRYKVTCPAGQSYLGYQCYADTDPESHWKLNYGGGVMVHFDRIALGVRLTGESKTAIVGLNF